MGSSLWYCSLSTVIGRKTVEFLLYLVHNGTSATGRPGYVVIVNKAIRLFFIYIYVSDPGISETLIPSLKSVPNNKQQRSGQEANAAIGEGHLIQLLIHGLFHLQEFFRWFWGFKWLSTYQKGSKLHWPRDRKCAETQLHVWIHTVQYSMLD